MLIDTALEKSLARGEIRELYLRHIPVLKNCENWHNVKEVGLIDHQTRYAHYKGMIVKYGNRFYYLPEKSIQALSPFRSWDRKNHLSVYDVSKQLPKNER